jgi:hypothetical protein
MPGLKPSVALTGLLAVGACAVAPPTGPNVLVLPPEGKDLAQFQREDGACRSYAQQQIGYGSPQQAAAQSAVGSAAVGTALGATAGALLGAAGGNAGAGAAIGAGGGLLAGSAGGAGTARAPAGSLQQRYDAGYLQCMTASGNKVPTTTAGTPHLYQPYSYYGSYGAPAYYGYPGYYPGYYGPYLGGPAVSLGFFGGWGHRHYNWGGWHHGGWGGWRGGWHGGGWHGGGRRR